MKREARGREERIMGKDGQLTSGICSFWSLYRQFFNKENRQRSLWRCQAVVITDVFYLRTKHILNKYLGIDWKFPTGSEPLERCYHLFKK